MSVAATAGRHRRRVQTGYRRSGFAFMSDASWRAPPSRSRALARGPSRRCRTGTPIRRRAGTPQVTTVRRAHDAAATSGEPSKTCVEIKKFMPANPHRGGRHRRARARALPSRDLRRALENNRGAIHAFERHGEPRLGADPILEQHGPRAHGADDGVAGDGGVVHAHAGASIIAISRPLARPSTSARRSRRTAPRRAPWARLARIGVHQLARVSSLSSHAGASGENGAFAGLFEGGQPRRPSSPRADSAS